MCLLDGLCLFSFVIIGDYIALPPLMNDLITNVLLSLDFKVDASSRICL